MMVVLDVMLCVALQQARLDAIREQKEKLIKEGKWPPKGS